MRKINLIFALLLSLMGVTQVKAGTFTETFDDVTVSSRYLLSNGWVMIHSNGNYQGFGGSYDYQIKSGNYDGGTGYSLYCSYSDVNEYVVIPTKLTGTFSYYARRAESSNGTITFFEATKNGDTFTIGSQLATTSTSSSWGDKKSFDLGTSGKYVAIQLIKSRIDQITASTIDEVSGPALMVTGDDNGTLNFGMVNPSETKELTLMNPGTESITVTISTTGGFTCAASKTIAAGGEETLEIAAPSETATGTVTITPNPAVDGINPVTITLSAVVKDPYKMFEDFSGKALPAEWTSTGSWTFTDGYAKTGNNTNLQLTTPMMVFEDGETFAFDAAGCSSWASYGAAYQGKVIVQTSTDGTNFSDLQTFSGMGLNEWQSCSVTIPAGTKYVRFVASYASIDNVYGGQLDQTPRPKLEVEGIANGGSLSWGYSDVPAVSTKTITLKNDGTADLDVTIAATDDYTVDPASATIEAGGSVVVTIGTPAHDGSGVLTITPSEESGLSPYTINLTSYYKEPKPVMSIDKTSIAFGKVNEVKSETITVSNTGDADLVVTITNDNTENFTVEPAQSLTVAPGETGTITVTYNYAEGIWGTFNANVKLTPNYGSTYDVKTITVSATSKDPNVWEEDFESGSIPSEWTNNGWTCSNSGYGNNGTYMASAGNSNDNTLVTPRLKAEEGQQLTFDISGPDSTDPLTIQYSSDGENWIDMDGSPFTAAGTTTFTAPSSGTYYLKFNGKYSSVDNFSGFQLDLLAADFMITASNLPTTGKQYATYEASVTVKNTGTEAQTAVAKLYFGTEEVDVQEAELAVGGEAVITLTYLPNEPNTFDNVSIEVTLKDVAEVEAKTVSAQNVEIVAIPQLSEDGWTYEEGTDYSTSGLQYSAKAGWNTIALPFAFTTDHLNKIFGENYKVYYCSGYSDGELSFRTTTNYRAGVPFIVYAESIERDVDNLVVLENISITATEPSTDDAPFFGTYSPIKAPDMQGKYGVVPSTGKIMKGGSSASLKGFRGYFELPADAQGVKINFYDENDNLVDAIDAVELNNAINGNLYDLSGRKVEGKAKTGVYIQNGKKVIVK